MTDLLATLLHNPLFAGGLALGLTGAVAALGRHIPQRLWDALLRQLIVTVDVVSGDPLFDALRIWFHQNRHTRKSRRVSASLDSAKYTAAGNEERSILFSPAPGDHFLVYRGRLCWITRERKEVTANNGGWGWFVETFTIRALTRDRELVRELLAEARALVERERTQLTGVFAPAWGSEWICCMRRAPRPLDSVLLPDGQAESVAWALREFLASEAWYLAMGIPYHLGCLFHGVPGSGKSSLASALAGALGLDIYMLSLGARGLDDDVLRKLVAVVPSRSMLLIEDVDCIFHGREAVSDKTQVTLAGLLNVLDGVASHHGSIVVMSTNHLDRLDPALTRRGRADIKVEFGYATTAQAAALWRRFFPARAGEAYRFATVALLAPASMADLQGFLLERRHDAERALTDAEHGIDAAPCLGAVDDAACDWREPL